MVTKTQGNKAKSDVEVTTPESSPAKDKGGWGSERADETDDEDDGKNRDGKKLDTGPTDGEVVSNHNSLSPAEPLGLAQVKTMRDYNPQRRESSRANVQSDTTTVNADHDAALVDRKGDRPSPHAPDADKGVDDFDDNALAAVEGNDEDLTGAAKDDGSK